MHLDETRSSQDNDAPVTIREQEPVHDADGVYQFVYRLLALPPEILTVVYFFACDGYPKIKVPGSVPNGIISLMLALKDPRLRSKTVKAVWQTCSIEWDGSLDSKAWQMFKKTVMPHIRCLTINFTLTYETWFEEDSEIRQTLAWMWNRGKPGNRARYLWCLEELHLVGLKYPDSFGFADWGWYVWEEYRLPGCKNWSEHFALTRLKKDGIKMSVEQKNGRRRILSVEGPPEVRALFKQFSSVTIL
jgi:hypothetical protein